MTSLDLSHALSVDLFQHHTRAPKWHDKEIQTNDFGSSSIKQAIPPRQKSKTYQASLAAAADVQHFQIFVRRICDIEAGFRSLPAAAAFRFSFWRRASRRGRPRCRRRHVRLLRQSGLAFSGSIIPEIERVNTRLLRRRREKQNTFFGNSSRQCRHWSG